jgi:hypothetical protein
MYQQIKTMTKKEFKEMASVHRYTGAGRDNNITAIMFDWKSGDKDNKVFAGFKYCVYARQLNATTEDLLKALYSVVNDLEDKIPWWIQVVIAMDDFQRFKVPISGNGLYNLKGEYKDL